MYNIIQHRILIVGPLSNLMAFENHMDSQEMQSLNSFINWNQFEVVMGIHVHAATWKI